MDVTDTLWSGQSDAALVQAARAGQRSAFDEIVRRHFGVVYAVGLARLGDRSQSEDLAQEVFLRAFLLLDKLTESTLLSHWLTRIARNLAVDWLRHGARARRL